ncbi:hypothetical protein PUR34_29860 [Streptomyces sp. JV185]|uniref:hypothetical protein n=1 Tax=Streptomyces sp. JV185 TaxID=858638 RepID=UPI002E789D89|nr:hypothetical protein [Streptomyces sp. JV185]MEE1772258.1 hypothetical protein [Streptomyces sp. JV185]
MRATLLHEPGEQGPAFDRIFVSHTWNGSRPPSSPPDLGQRPLFVFEDGRDEDDREE